MIANNSMSISDNGKFITYGVPSDLPYNEQVALELAGRLPIVAKINVVIGNHNDWVVHFVVESQDA